MAIAFIGIIIFVADAFKEATADTSIEDSATAVKAGDATVASSLIINNNFIDPSHNCEGCTKMVYTPGSRQEAGIAYKDDTLDWRNPKGSFSSQRANLVIKSVCRQQVMILV